MIPIDATPGSVWTVTPFGPSESSLSPDDARQVDVEILAEELLARMAEPPMGSAGENARALAALVGYAFDAAEAFIAERDRRREAVR